HLVLSTPACCRFVVAGLLVVSCPPLAPRPVFFDDCCGPRALHSFPTRRSSDLCGCQRWASRQPRSSAFCASVRSLRRTRKDLTEDRKSTRLNSSHGSISYAVFCLKKKTKYQQIQSFIPTLDEVQPYAHDRLGRT